MENIDQKLDLVLPFVTRPGRYTGNEIHVIRKKWESVEVHFALAFPDVYEIGMSNVGMGILYHLLNQCDWIAAERVYSPWIDMEQKMREAHIPLFSLESKKSVRFFDIVGISIQHELQYTNVINLLDLAGIPLRSSERNERDPIVIAGGLCAFNPEPLALFLDAVVLGDGEEVIIEIAEVMRKSKRERKNREKTLRALSQLEGVYVPSFYYEEIDSDGAFKGTVPKTKDICPKVRARTLDCLSLGNYPSKPLVPLIEVTHDRFSMEIMRGCTRGCRFCNAGMIYRPVRERSVEDLVKQAKTTIQNTGYDEISLMSLSTSDYFHLPCLISDLKTAFHGKEISISFPSLRTDSFTLEMAEFAYGLRRTGLTFAPEAGTQRLRHVINKNAEEEDLFRAVEIGFKQNWPRVKLYFMIGLPSETLDDIQGIIDMVWQVVLIARKYGKKEIIVSISPFSPKPQTPFQWESQDNLEIMNEKILLLKNKLKWPEVHFSWRDPQISRLETMLGRGDRKIGEVIYRAWEKGARFDAWSDQFRYDLWDEAMKRNAVSIDNYVGSKNIHDPLPWDHLDKGVSKLYFLQEREKALSEVSTDDCRLNPCQECGLSEHPVCRKLVSFDKTDIKTPLEQSQGLVYGRRIKYVQKPLVKMKLRLGYRKMSEVRFTSHLDLIRIFIRALRRATIPVAFSQGYHQHPKIETCPPLPLGFTSQAEYIDLEITDHLPRDFEGKINRCLPLGLEIFSSKVFFKKMPTLNSLISLASYYIDWGEPVEREEIHSCIDTFMKKNSHRIMVHRKEITKELDLRDFIVKMSQNDRGVDLVMRFSPQGTPKLNEVIEAVFPNIGDSLTNKRIERTGLYLEKQGIWLTPLDIE